MLKFGKCLRFFSKGFYREPDTVAHKFHKSMCNKKFIEESQKVSSHKFGNSLLGSMNFLVVDSGVANSSRGLINLGAKKENITIINYNIEDCNKLKKENFNIEMYHLNKYLESTTKLYDAFYLDVTNQGDYLCNCIDIILKRKLLKNSYGIISGVFTARNRRGNSVLTIRNMIKNTVENYTKYTPSIEHLNYNSSNNKRMEFFIIKTLIN